MARTELPNGIILPAEYSDDWYDDMTSNLSKLDEVIGSDAEKLSAENVGAAALSNDYTDLDNKPALKPVATSGDYDDLDNKPALKPVATSGDYDDLTDLPTYGITRLCSSAITDNSNVAFANISSVDKIKAGDFLLDNAGKMYLIASVDTVNETAAVTTPLTVLAVDSGVVHINGNENINDNKNFTGLLTTLVNGTLWPVVNHTTDDITLLSANAVHVEQRSSGNLTDLSAGAWNIAELGNAAFFFRHNSGVDIRYKHFPTNLVNRIYVVDGANRHINDLIPNKDNTRDVGSNSLRWATFNGINPGALSLPDLNNGLDISGYIDVNRTSEYTAISDGFISICGTASANNAIAIKDKNFDYAVGGRAMTISSVETTYVLIPVLSNHTYEIICSAVSSIVWAKFFPNLGNV